MAGDASTSRQRWELENNVAQVQQVEAVDALYHYNAEEQKAIQSQRPWKADPHFFKHVRMSALALLKMAMHARSGGSLEVMGMLQGKILGDTFIVIDSFALPVEGTETRVNAQAEAYEYMVDFADTNKKVHRPENVVGWYHSHPGYGCWLSGIDCSTQMLNQQYQEPWLAIVVDPVRTMASGKVEIGAFRTYPEGYKPPDDGPSEYQTIPLSKIEDFGVHAKQYYSLDISFFKSSTDQHMLDLLWNKYWVSTLSANPLLANREFAVGQVQDIAEKLEQAEQQMTGAGRMGRHMMAGPSDKAKKGAKEGEESALQLLISLLPLFLCMTCRPPVRDVVQSALQKICRDTGKLAAEQLKGLSSLLVKQLLFNCNCNPHNAACRLEAAPPGPAKPSTSNMEL